MSEPAEMNMDENLPETDADAAASQAAENPIAAELAAVKDQLLRTAADAQNAARRFEKEKDDIRKYAVGNFARELLNVSDNLTRALEAIPVEARDANETLKTLFVGVEATERQLQAAFVKMGITPMDPKGQTFDPNFHQVMFETESTEAPGTVLQVLQQGYMISDRLLRPALVGVAKSAGQKVSTEA